MSRSFDPSRFAREGGSIQGVVPSGQLARVAQELVEPEGSVQYSLRGSLTAKGEPAIRIELRAVLNLACQRCMEPLPISLQIGKTLVFTRDVDELAPAADEDEDVDAVPLVAKVDVLELIDEELMLSLPIAPRHEEGACAARFEDAPDADHASPFAVLSRLKKT